MVFMMSRLVKLTMSRFSFVMLNEIVKENQRCVFQCQKMLRSVSIDF